MLSFYLSLLDNEEDKKRFEEIYMENRDLMFNVANQILRHAEHSEDAVHHAFVHMIEIWDQIKERTCPQIAALGVIISRNTAKNLAKRNKYRNYIPLDELTLEDSNNISVDEEAISNISFKHLMEQIHQLPEIHRDVLLLHYCHDLTTVQMAKILTISNEAAKKRLQRARNQLMAALLEEE